MFVLAAPPDVQRRIHADLLGASSALVIGLGLLWDPVQDISLTDPIVRTDDTGPY